MDIRNFAHLHTGKYGRDSLTRKSLFEVENRRCYGIETVSRGKAFWKADQVNHMKSLDYRMPDSTKWGTRYIDSNMTVKWRTLLVRVRRQRYRAQGSQPLGPSQYHFTHPVQHVVKMVRATGRSLRLYLMIGGHHLAGMWTLRPRRDLVSVTCTAEKRTLA